MIVCSIEHGRKVLQSLAGALWLTMDTETVPKAEWMGHKEATLIHGRHRIKIFSICYRGVSYSFPTNLLNAGFPTISEWAELFNWYFRKINPNVVIVYHNGNYDIRVLIDMGFDFPKRFWDTMISGWLANGNEDKSLKARAPFYGRYIRDTKTIDFTDLTQLANYAEYDVVVTDEIYQQHTKGRVSRPAILIFVGPKGEKITKPNPMPELEISVPTEVLSPFDRMFLRNQEFPILRSTIACERNGVPLDVSELKRIRVPMEADVLKYKKAIYRAAGKVFNINSGKEKLAVINRLNMQVTKFSRKTGKPSLNYESMLTLKGQHPIIDDMLEYSKVDKMQSVYLGVDGFQYYLNPKTGCIHPNLNTVGAVTGRFSASAPNMQTVPSRNDKYKIKRCFVAPKGESLICLDFSQIELRVMAMLSQDPVMSKVLNDPEGDIHTTTADNLEVPRDPVAKQCNFLLIFGGGAKALCQRLRIEGHNTTEEECQAFIDGFNGLYERVAQFREEMFTYHRQHGFIPLLTGRRRVIENLDSSNQYLRHRAETQLANNVIQGSAQDLMKALILRCDFNRPNFDRELPKMINMGKEHLEIIMKQAAYVDKYRAMFRKAGVRWRLQVHDEVLYTAKKQDAYDVGMAVAHMMTFRPYWEPMYEMGVVIRGDGGVGANWLEAKKPTDPKLKLKWTEPLAA